MFLIPDDLAMYFEMPFGSIMTRSEITEKLCYIIVGKGLIDPTNRRRILPDDELILLLQIPYGQELTFYNLQTFLTQFCTRPVPPPAGYIPPPRPRTDSDDFEEVIVDTRDFFEPTAVE